MGNTLKNKQELVITGEHMWVWEVTDVCQGRVARISVSFTSSALLLYTLFGVEQDNSRCSISSPYCFNCISKQSQNQNVLYVFMGGFELKLSMHYTKSFERLKIILKATLSERIFIVLLLLTISNVSTQSFSQCCLFLNYQVVFQVGWSSFLSALLTFNTELLFWCWIKRSQMLHGK